MKVRIVAALLLILAASTIPGCVSTPARVYLPFQALDLGWGSYTGRSLAFDVLADASSPLPTWLSPEPPWLESVDFSADFVVLVRVPPPQRAFLVTDAWQVGKTVYIRAQFVAVFPGTADTEGSPGETVKVNKGKMRQFGEITFKLLDDYGKERASTTAVISQH